MAVTSTSGGMESQRVGAQAVVHRHGGRVEADEEQVAAVARIISGAISAALNRRSGEWLGARR